MLPFGKLECNIKPLIPPKHSNQKKIFDLLYLLPYFILKQGVILKRLIHFHFHFHFSHRMRKGTCKLSCLADLFLFVIFESFFLFQLCKQTTQIKKKNDFSKSLFFFFVFWFENTKNKKQKSKQMSQFIYEAILFFFRFLFLYFSFIVFIFFFFFVRASKTKRLFFLKFLWSLHFKNNINSNKLIMILFRSNLWKFPYFVSSPLPPLPFSIFGLITN